MLAPNHLDSDHPVSASSSSSSSSSGSSEYYSTKDGYPIIVVIPGRVSTGSPDSVTSPRRRIDENDDPSEEDDTAGYSALPPLITISSNPTSPTQTTVLSFAEHGEQPPPLEGTSSGYSYLWDSVASAWS